MVMTRLAFTDFSVSLDVDDVVDRKSPINQFHQKNMDNSSLRKRATVVHVRIIHCQKKGQHTALYDVNVT